MAGDASRRNGKKGGRPPGSIAPSTLKARLQREYLTQQFEEELESIVRKAVEDAKRGDSTARAWLSDQAWGRATNRTEITGAAGKDLFEPSGKIKEIAHELVTRGNGQGASSSG